MPIMNGIDATKAIIKYEKDNNLKHIPIIAVTANATRENRDKFLSEGMDEFITKPIDLNLFLNILKKFFKNKNILIYKKTTIESKIIGAIVQKLGYRVDITTDIDEFKDLLNGNSYYTILLDRVTSDIQHKEISEMVENLNIPTILFIDEQTVVTERDRDIYSDITLCKAASFDKIRDKIVNLQERLQPNKSSI